MVADGKGGQNNFKCIPRFNQELVKCHSWPKDHLQIPDSQSREIDPRSSY